jgi:hypothetical protein
MNIFLSFIGKLPNYILCTLHQIRIYSDLPIYLIYDDYNSQYIDKIKTYNITLIKYNTVNQGYEKLKIYQKKFYVVHGLGNRKFLFFRSFERFYIIENAMKLYKLNNILHIEIDNLIYDDPKKWMNIFEKNNVQISFSHENVNMSSAGIIYFKDINSIHLLNNYFDNYYLDNPSVKFYKEMEALYMFYLKHKEICFILPSMHWNDSNFPKLHENFSKFGSIFDPASYGVYLLGSDTFHTGGKIIKYKKNHWGYINPTKNIQWLNDGNKKKPYIMDNEKKILINNLHVHSKDLISGLSIPMK